MHDHTLLYLHGFNSSPQSAKARATRDWLAQHGAAGRFVCPALPFSPAAAAALIEATIAGLDTSRLAVAGSSLGGFYATWVAERWGCRAVLINPSVTPWQTLGRYLGPQTNRYTGEQYLLESRHMDELLALHQPALTLERYWLLVETGDETLDYREAERRYAGAKQTRVIGGDHSFTHWVPMLPATMDWLGVA